MFHNKAYRKLGRTHTHRMATLRALSTALFERERIRTTLMKAKELRPFAEKLITRSKRDDLHARRQVLRHIQDRAVAKKLFETLSARFMDRPGGYTRILRLGTRKGDGAEMAIVELIGSEPVFKKQETKKTAQAAKKKTRPGLASRLMGGRRAAKKEAESAAAEAETAQSGDAEPAETEAAPKSKGRRPSRTKTGKGAKKK